MKFLSSFIIMNINNKKFYNLTEFSKEMEYFISNSQNKPTARDSMNNSHLSQSTSFGDRTAASQFIADNFNIENVTQDCEPDYENITLFVGANNNFPKKHNIKNVSKTSNDFTYINTQYVDTKNINLSSSKSISSKVKGKDTAVSDSRIIYPNDKDTDKKFIYTTPFKYIDKSTNIETHHCLLCDNDDGISSNKWNLHTNNMHNKEITSKSQVINTNPLNSRISHCRGPKHKKLVYSKLLKRKIIKNNTESKEIREKTTYCELINTINKMTITELLHLCKLAYPYKVIRSFNKNLLIEFMLNQCLKGNNKVTGRHTWECYTYTRY